MDCLQRCVPTSNDRNHANSCRLHTLYPLEWSTRCLDVNGFGRKLCERILSKKTHVLFGIFYKGHGQYIQVSPLGELHGMRLGRRNTFGCFDCQQSGYRALCRMRERDAPLEGHSLSQPRNLLAGPGHDSLDQRTHVHCSDARRHSPIVCIHGRNL